MYSRNKKYGEPYLTLWNDPEYDGLCSHSALQEEFQGEADTHLTTEEPEKAEQIRLTKVAETKKI